MDAYKARLESMKLMREQSMSRVGPTPATTTPRTGTTTPAGTTSTTPTSTTTVTTTPASTTTPSPASTTPTSTANKSLITPAKPGTSTTTTTSTANTTSTTSATQPSTPRTGSSTNLAYGSRTGSSTNLAYGSRTGSSTNLAVAKPAAPTTPTSTTTAAATTPTTSTPTTPTPTTTTTPATPNAATPKTAAETVAALRSASAKPPSLVTMRTISSSNLKAAVATGTSTPTAATPNPELIDMKNKYEAEVKKRQDIEKRFQDKVKEVATLKTQLQRAMIPSAPVARPPPSSGSSLGMGGSGMPPGMMAPSGPMSALDRRAARISKRISVKPGMGPGSPGGMGRPGARKSIHVANQLTSLVSEIAKIELAIQAAHAARAEAEDRLYDICTDKLTLDGVFSKVLQNQSDVEAILRLLTLEVSRLPGADNAKTLIQSARKGLVDSISYAVKESGIEHTIPTLDFDASKVISVVKAPTAPPAPPSMPLPPTQKPPAPPSAPKPSVPSNQSSGGSGSGMSARLLDQIRGGTSLKQIDLQKLKEEREAAKKERRKSMAQMKSLTDTLKEALITRAEDLMGDDDEDDDDEDEDWM